MHVGSPHTPALTTMEPGDCVGEMSIIEDRDPSAYVIGAENNSTIIFPVPLDLITPLIGGAAVNASRVIRAPSGASPSPAPRVT